DPEAEERDREERAVAERRSVAAERPDADHEQERGAAHETEEPQRELGRPLQRREPPELADLADTLQPAVVLAERRWHRERTPASEVEERVDDHALPHVVHTRHRGV